MLSCDVVRPADAGENVARVTVLFQSLRAVFGHQQNQANVSWSELPYNTPLYFVVLSSDYHQNWHICNSPNSYYDISTQFQLDEVRSLLFLNTAVNMFNNDNSNKNV